MSFVTLRCVWERRFGGIAILHAKPIEHFAGIRGLRKEHGDGKVGTAYIQSKKAFDTTEVLDCVCFGQLGPSTYTATMVTLLSPSCRTKSASSASDCRTPREVSLFLTLLCQRQADCLRPESALLRRTSSLSGHLGST